MDEVFNVWIDHIKCEYGKFTLTNNKWKRTKTKTISKKKGEQLYRKYYSSGEVLYFKKIS